MFNGSASLRNAAGQLIENVTKSMRRREEVNDVYFTELYDDITALYRLDGQNNMSDTRMELGELPLMSKLLIGTIVLAWVLIGVYILAEKVKKHKK